MLGEGLAVYPMQLVIFLDLVKQSKAPEQPWNGLCGEIFFFVTYSYNDCFQGRELNFSVKFEANEHEVFQVPL